MSNGDDAMTSAEFAKLMGAYPEPAGNPLPAYGGYMDNSAANFAWVNNNDYFGAETWRKPKPPNPSHETDCECDECDPTKGCVCCYPDGAGDCEYAETFEAGFLRKNYPEGKPEPNVALPGSPEALKIKAMPDRKKAATDGLSLEVKIWNGMEEQDDLGTVEGRIIIPLSHTELWGPFEKDKSWDEHAQEQIQNLNFEIFIDGEWRDAFTWAANS